MKNLIPLLLILFSTSLHSQYFTPDISPVPIEGVAYSAVAIADVDNNGFDDVFITGQNRDDQIIAKLYLNNNLTFTEVTGTPFDGVIYGSAAFADTDNDGDEDLVITGLNSSQLPIAKYYLNDNGVFTEVAGTSLVGVQYSSLAFSDIDMDGDKDLLITGWNNIDWVNPIYNTRLYENIDGVFTVIQQTPFPDLSNGSISFADIDGDLDEDLFLSGIDNSNSKYAKLYLNDGNGQFEEIPDTPMPGINGSLFLNSTSDFGDIDNDGDMDLVINGYDALSNNRFEIYLNNEGVFTEYDFIGDDFPHVIGGQVSFVDKDNDNFEDIIVTGSLWGQGNFSVLLLNEEGEYSIDDCNPFFPSARSLIGSADFDNNGFIDIIIPGFSTLDGYPRTHLYTNDEGSFSKAPGSEIYGASAGSIDYSDIDQDGDLDLLVARASSGFTSNPKRKTIATYENIDGQFVEISCTPWSQYVSAATEFVDVDGDGDEDIFVTGIILDDNSEVLSATLYVNDQGSFNQVNNSFFAGVAEGDVSSADIDGDGDIDILVNGSISLFNGSTNLYINNGQGAFTENVNTPFIDLSRGETNFFDFDADNDYDVLFIGQNDIVLYENDGNGNFTEVDNSILYTSNGHNAEIGDINNDGYPEVLIVGGFSFDLFLNNEGEFTEMNEDPFPSFSAEVADFSDVDGDGDLDIMAGWNEPRLFINQNGNFDEFDISTNDVINIGDMKFFDFDMDGDEDIFISENIALGYFSTRIYINDSSDFFVELESIHIAGESTHEMEVNETLQLEVVYTPEDATNQNVIWGSADPLIAEVSQDGLVTAIAPGNTDINVISQFDNSLQSFVSISVSEVLTTRNKLNTTFSLSPNPVQTDGLILITSSRNIKQLEIFHYSGKLINSIDLDGTENTLLKKIPFASGVYFIRVFTTSNEYGVRKLIVE